MTGDILQLLEVGTNLGVIVALVISHLHTKGRLDVHGVEITNLKDRLK